MALKICKDCGNKISKSAKTCPQCGAKQKKGGCLKGLFKLIIYLIIGLLAISLINYLLNPTDTHTDNDQKPKHEEIQKQVVESEKETPIVLDTDYVLTQHIESLKAKIILTRKIWVSSNPNEIQNLKDQQKQIRANKAGDFSQIKDALFFEKTYIDAYNRCVSIAEKISQSNNESEIDDLITDALVYQTLAWDAWLYIQDTDLNYPADRIKVISNSNKVLSPIFADERVLKLPIDDFKIAVINALPNLQKSKTEFNKF